MFGTQDIRANRRTYRNPFVAGADAARRALLAFGLAASVLTSTLGPPTTPDVVAAPEPSARLEIVVKSIRVHDDNEGILSGEGEMQLYTGVWRCNEGVPPPCMSYLEGASQTLETQRFTGTGGPIVRSGAVFNASTGETVTLDRSVPGAGDVMWGGNTSPELGFAVYANQQYVVQFEMVEWDGGCAFNCSEYMGYRLHVLDTGEHGLGVGTHTARSVRSDGVTPGDYSVTYEIRRVPLPDLKPVNIKVFDLPGNAKKQVCMAVQNIDIVHASPFEVELKRNNQPVPGGKYTIGLLASGTHFDACVNVALPATGQYKLSAAVDEARAVTESNEANNLYEILHKATGSAATATEPATEPTTEATPTATSSKDQPDLVVSAIKVNGRVPDGKDDCKNGKNDVTVVVKNQGTKQAGDFAVQLVVDGDQGGPRQQKLDDGLEAGDEETVTFKGVTLKKGSGTLAATADSTTEIAESNETNNARTVTASCKDN